MSARFRSAPIKSSDEQRDVLVLKKEDDRKISVFVVVVVGEEC
jgi:hypothetical protein